MTVIERFLKFVSFDTTSSETSGQQPSTPNQKVLGGGAGPADARSRYLRRAHG